MALIGAGSANIETDSANAEKYAVYKRRWLMLFVVFILNVSNGGIWINFAAIVNATGAYFGVSNSAVDWFSLVFFITTIPFMFIAMYVMDTYGFKVGIQIGCAMNLAGSVVRLFGTFDWVAETRRYPVALAGQTIASLAQPFAMSLPTKVSELWFPESQRPLSTAIGAMANPFGFMLGSLISAVIVSDKNDVPTLNIVFCCLGMVAGLCGFLVRSGKPPKPPSHTAAKPDLAVGQSYLTSLMMVAKNKDFIILMLAIGGGMGLVSALQTMMGQIICPWGYDDDVAGLCCAVMVVGGFVGAGIISYIAEKTKKFEEIVNIGFAITVVIAIIFVLVNHIRKITWALAVLCTFLGFLGMGLYPTALEVAVETTYPVDESISAGCIVVVGQILGTVFMLVMEALERPLSTEAKDYEQCTVDGNSDAADLIYSGIFLVAVASVLSILLSIFFRPTYKRMEAEVKKRVPPSNVKRTSSVVSTDSWSSQISKQ